jgi:hypothetical protein
MNYTKQQRLMLRGLRQHIEDAHANGEEHLAQQYNKKAARTRDMFIEGVAIESLFE